VSNHSGGTLALDAPIPWIGFSEKFGYDRLLYPLAHDLAFPRRIGEIMMQSALQDLATQRRLPILGRWWTNRGRAGHP
jgi:hypothetical protein